LESFLKPYAVVSLILCALSLSPAAWADPGYYVVTAYDHEGVRSADFRYWSVKAPGEPAQKWPELGLGYGVTSRWYTEVLASWIGSSQEAMKLSTLNWQNEFLLTQGNLPVDVALHASLISDQGYEGGYEIEYGPVLQTDIGRTQLNANLFFARNFGGDEDDPPETKMKYQWQVRHRTHPLLNLGLQGFGEVGRWNQVSPRERQSHRAGPAFFGTVRLDDGRSLQYQGAYLFGKTYGRRGDMFSMRMQVLF
jgi:hypothetical protein